MKKIIGCSCLALSMLAGGAWAAEVDMNATTLIGFEESYNGGFDKEFRVPAVQYLRTDVYKLGDENLSFHFYGWGKWKIEDGDTEGDLTTGYLNYRFPKSNGYLKAGRFYEFQTSGVEQIDGLGVGADIAKGLRLSFFGGAPVLVDNDNKGDYIYGGKLAYRYPKFFGLGVSTVREVGGRINRLADEAGGDRDERFLVSGDAWVTPHKNIDINANATYNITTDNIAEQRYQLVLKPMEKLSISGEYRHYRLEDYFAFTNLTFSPFHQRGKLREYGGTANFNLSKSIELTGFYKYFDHEDTENPDQEEGASDRFGASLRYKAGSGIASVQYMVVDGKQDEDRSYQQVYVYGLYDVTKTVNVSAYALMDFYNRAKYDTNYAVRLSGSAGYKITKNLKVAGQVAYDHDPFVQDGVTGMLWLKYDLKI